MTSIRATDLSIVKRLSDILKYCHLQQLQISKFIRLEELSHRAKAIMQLKTNSKFYSHKNFVALLILGSACFFYSIQAWLYSRRQNTLLDEGNYLLKGFLFVTKKYTPFQQFGPWTNKMPLSFLVPGYIQKIFSPGLTTGRIYAFVLSILILVSTILLSYRLGGKYGAAFSATLLAINPAPLKIYSRVLSESLTAFLLVITLLLILGKDRSLWEILAGSFIAGMIPITRINLLPVLPLVIGYLFWQHGFKKGIICLLSSLIPFIGVHLLYWPGILQLWARWIPNNLFLQIDIWKQRFGNIVRVHDPQPTLPQRLMAFAQGVRLEFAMILSVFSAICLWPNEWRDRDHKHTTTFMLFLFTALFLTHLVAVVFLEFNIHAFFRYITPFQTLGILIFICTIENWNFNVPKWKLAIIGIGILLFPLIIGISVSEQSSFYGVWIKRELNKHALTFHNGGLEIAAWKWWELFQNRLGWNYITTFKVISVSLVVVTMLILISSFVILYWYFIGKNKCDKPISFLPHALTSLMVVGVLLSPSKFLGRGYDFYDCNLEPIQQYQAAIDLTSKYVAENDQVFWIGKNTQIILLGLLEEKDIRIFPQQLNSYNSFFIGGNTEELISAGFWNDDIAQEWVDRSQILIFEEQAYNDWFSTAIPKLNLSDFMKVAETGVLGCEAGQNITIYARINSSD